MEKHCFLFVVSSPKKRAINIQEHEFAQFSKFEILFYKGGIGDEIEIYFQKSVSCFVVFFWVYQNF